MGIKQLFSVFFFLLLFANIAFAQAPDVMSTITSLLVQSTGIIFIIIFVIILLVIGGVLKFPKDGGISAGLIAFFILIILAFVLPQFVTFPDYVKAVPDSFKYWELPEAGKDALQLIGLPREWGFIPAIIYLFILPFAAIYALFWAFLVTLNIFSEKNINRLLAFIVAFLTIPMGWFTKMVWALFGFMGVWSVAVFAVTFVAGAFFKGATAVGKEYSEYKKYVKKGKMEVSMMYEKLKIAREGTPAEMRRLAAQFSGTAEALGLSRLHRQLVLASVDTTSDEDVKKAIDEAIKELEKQK